MNTTSKTVRSLAAFFAAAITMGLLSTVVSISEPQGGILLARSQRNGVVVAAGKTSAVALAETTRTAR